MSNRISQRFATCKRGNRSAFIPYIMAGDPSPAATLAIMHALADNGADILEIGFPFSDPVADGATIQAAGNRALAEGINLQTVLNVCAEFRQKNTSTPLIIMGYANPLMQYGYGNCAAAMQAAGIDGVIVVDLPPEEEGELLPHLNAHGLSLIRLIAPTTKKERLERLLKSASGFVYVIGINGITGTGSADLDVLQQRIAEIRTHISLPVVTGFGIRTTDQARELCGIADGIVVGSALVDTLHKAGTAGAVQAASKFARAMAESLTLPLPH